MSLFGDKQPGQFAAAKFVGKLRGKTKKFRDMIILAESTPKDGTGPVDIDSVSYSEIGMFVLSAAVWRIDSNPSIDLKPFFPVFGGTFIDDLERTAEKDGQEISRKYIGANFPDRYDEYSVVFNDHHQSTTGEEITDTGIQILWSLIVNTTNKEKPSDFVTATLLIPELHKALQDIYQIVDK